MAKFENKSKVVKETKTEIIEPIEKITEPIEEVKPIENNDKMDIIKQEAQIEKNKVKKSVKKTNNLNYEATEYLF